MFDYLQKQISLMNKIRLTLRVTGIIAGVSAAMSPFIFISFASRLGDGFAIVGELAAAAVLLGIPTGINFMCLAIGLRGRIKDLGALSSLTEDASRFVPVLQPYLRKIGVHRIILWVVAGLIMLQGLTPLSSYSGDAYAQNFGILVISAPVAAIFAGVHAYLAVILQRQIKDLTPALNS